MKYKLIDVKQEVEEDVAFGTCELCMYVVDHQYTVAVIEDEEGNVFELENGYWSCGDYFIYSYESIENVIDFAAWFSEQDLPSDLDESTFWGLVAKYHDEKGAN